MIAALALSVSKIGLDQDEIDAALDQRIDLLAIDRLDLVEVDFAIRRDR